MSRPAPRSRVRDATTSALAVAFLAAAAALASCAGTGGSGASGDDPSDGSPDAERLLSLGREALTAAQR